MSNGKVIRVDGVSFLGLLAVAFIVLRLCKVIMWSWLWVLAPIWAPLVLLIIVLVVGVIVAVVRQECK